MKPPKRKRVSETLRIVYHEASITPFRCSRGHLMLVTRTNHIEPGNCDRAECIDNDDQPVQCGPWQRVRVEVTKLERGK